MGFADLGNKDDFPTLALSRRLINSGTIVAKSKAEKGITITKKGRHQHNDDDDSGEDY